jgi:hypothetical protein
MRSLLGPLVLISIGMVFLLHNFGVVPLADVRQLLERWWPLILIVIGFWLLIERLGKRR